MRVPQRGDGLVVVVGGGPDVGDHDGLAVPAQRVLQDARQLRVPATHGDKLQRTYVLELCDVTSVAVEVVRTCRARAGCSRRARR